jgi:acetylserotonin N-methyltransferase
MSTYEPPTANDQRIWELWLTQTYQGAIVAADEMGFFSALAGHPATITELAARLDYDERATGVIVRLLASLRLLVEREHRFQLMDDARLYLLKSSPYYWGHMMRVGVNEWHVSTLIAALKKKDSANAAGPQGTPKSGGMGRSVDGWAEGNISPEQARSIAERMHSHSLVPAIGAARNYDFRHIKRILDVGGGSGCFMIAVARTHPEIQCTIMDLPAMCDVAQTYIRDAGVESRVDTRAVDMFRQPWPEGYDAVFFSNVWHDWNFRTCTWLAERAFEALPSGGRIMLHEMLLDDDGAGPATAASFSLLMLLATQGQQFTFGELKSILESAGFTGVEASHTCGYYSITTARKP